MINFVIISFSVCYNKLQRLLQPGISVAKVVLYVENALLVIKVFIFVGNFTKDVAGIADGDDIVGKILCHNASGADYYVIADFDTGHDYGVSANPHIVPYGDGDAVLIAGISGFRMERVSGGVDGHIRRNLGIFPNNDFAYIQDGKVVIGKEIFTYFDVASVVTMKRSIDKNIFAGFA